MRIPNRLIRKGCDEVIKIIIKKLSKEKMEKAETQSTQEGQIKLASEKQNALKLLPTTESCLLLLILHQL